MKYQLRPGPIQCIIQVSFGYRAPVAELVDAADSKSVIGNDVGVRVSLGAPITYL